MMRLSKILYGLWGVLLVSALGFSHIAGAADAKNSILKEDIAYTIDKGGFKGTVPQFKTANDTVSKKVIRKINAYFRKYLDTHYSEYKHDDARKTYTISIFAKEKSIGNNTLSYALYDSFYAKGATHPFTGIEGLTVTLDKGKRISWEQLIQRQDRTAFSPQQITAALHNKRASDAGEFSSDGTITTEPGSYSFIVDKDGFIHILFQQYEVAPYCAGFVTLNTGIKTIYAR